MEELAKDLTTILPEIITGSFPVIITGIYTFILTKYSFYKNVPLDKLEISYNRVYYPLYRMLRNTPYKNVNHVKILNDSHFIFLKYDKYVSLSTRNVYENYKEMHIYHHHNNKEMKKYYLNYANNVLEYNIRLRNKLGYPHVSIIESYKYLPKTDKNIIDMGFLLTMIYIFIFLYYSYENNLLFYIILCLLIIVTVKMIKIIYSLVINVIQKNKYRRGV